MTGYCRTFTINSFSFYVVGGSKKNIISFVPDTYT
jgi:hypothetical protein